MAASISFFKVRHLTHKNIDVSDIQKWKGICDKCMKTGASMA